MNHHRIIAIMMLLTVGIVGCSNDPFALVPVTGTVKFEDGTPVLNSTYKIRFVPQIDSPDGITYPRVATVEVDGEGNFISATTSRYKDGLAVGEHIVYFDLDKDSKGKPIVPMEYTRSKTSPIKVDLSKSRHLEIVVPKP